MLKSLKYEKLFSFFATGGAERLAPPFLATTLHTIRDGKTPGSSVKPEKIWFSKRAVRNRPIRTEKTDVVHPVRRTRVRNLPVYARH